MYCTLRFRLTLHRCAKSKFEAKDTKNTTHLIFQMSNVQVTFLPKCSSTKAIATLLANLTSPAFELVYGKSSINDDSNIFLIDLLRPFLMISACSLSYKSFKCLNSAFLKSWFLRSRLSSSICFIRPLDCQIVQCKRFKAQCDYSIVYKIPCKGSTSPYYGETSTGLKMMILGF